MIAGGDLNGEAMSTLVAQVKRRVWLFGGAAPELTELSATVRPWNQDRATRARDLVEGLSGEVPPHDGFILMAQPVNLHMAASIQLIKTLDGGREPFEDSRRGRK